MSHSQESQDFEFSPLNSTTVALPYAAVNWAVQISQTESDQTKQWQSFLRALALRGFQQWVEAGALDVAVYYNIEQVPPADITCRVGDFRLCLVIQGNLSDELIQIPRATLKEPDRWAHLYVLIEVEEETDRVTILGGLRRDHLLAHQQATQWILRPDDTYMIPVQYFDTPPEDVLLYLNCLNPERLTTPVTLASETTEHPLLTHEPISSSTELINVGRWLRDQLGDVADRLAWTLLPPLQQLDTGMALRSPVEEIGDILTEIAPNVTVPPSARGAYTDCQSFGLSFRLYALTWKLFETEVSEWSLLLCLGPSDNRQLPPGTRLTIRDRTSVLVEQTLASNSDTTYLYGAVIGNDADLFTMTIELPNGAKLNWPPFGFRSEV